VDVGEGLIGIADAALGVFEQARRFGFGDCDRQVADGEGPRRPFETESLSGRRA